MEHDNDRTVVRSRARHPVNDAGNEGSEDMNSNVLPVGLRLGEFEITGLIGEGGFGIVYMAYDHSLERHVAVKEYMPSGLASRTTSHMVTMKSQHYAETFAAGLRSFVNEAKMLAQFDSSSLVKVYRFWEDNGTAYMVMPFYEGITLKQAIKERSIVPDENWIRAFLANLCDAIETIHAVQCYHRDIAPDNILILTNGRPLLLDFGAARRVIGDRTQGLTVILKPGFAPIEQYADIPGLRQGPWTDMYALAAVVYYLITGKAPPQAIARMVNDDMIPAREAGKGRYSEPFLATLDRALAVRPEQRIQSITQFRHELDIDSDVPRTMPPPMSPGRSRNHGSPQPHNEYGLAEPMIAERRDIARHRSRSRLLWIVPAFLIILGVAAGIYWMNGIQFRMDKEEPLSAGRTDQPATPPVAGLAPDSTTGRAEPVAPPSSGLADQLAAAATPPPVADVAKPEAPDPPVGQAPLEPDLALPRPAPPVDQPAAPLVQPIPAPTRLSPEEELWVVVRNANKAAGYETYLSEYPKGRYAAAARQAIEKARPKTAQVEPPPVAQAPATDRKAAKPVPASQDSPNPLRDAPPAKAPAATGDTTPPAPKPAEQAATAPVRQAVPATQAQQVQDERQSTPPNKPSSDKPAESDEQVAVLSKRPAPEPPVTPAPEATTPPSTESPAPSPRTTLKLDGQTMTGDFTVDRTTGIVSGKGSIAWTNGDRFEGALVRGLKEGKGVFTWADGRRYSGDWLHDKAAGKGIIAFIDGRRYEGEVKDGVPEGRGIFSFPNGDRYEGEMRAGLQHGEGTVRFKSGDAYKGTWIKGKSHGRGRYTWANGGYWEGEFRDGTRTENGAMTFADKDAPRPSTSGNSAGSSEQRSAGSSDSGQ